MKFFLPVGGITDNRFGILTNYNHNGIPEGIANGMEWAGDVPVYNNVFEPEKWKIWLETMKPYRETCRFISCPDEVGQAQKTLNLYALWRPYLDGWSVAFVAQDGQEKLEFPNHQTWDVLFIGGGTEWKLSQGAIDCIKRAQTLNKKIHIGRVNWGRRYRHFRLLGGSEEFSCDGTRTRFEGTKKTMEAWAAYQAQSPLFGI